MFLLAVSCGFSLVLDPRGRLGGLEVVVRNLRTVRLVYLVNVYESSGAAHLVVLDKGR